MTRLPDAFPQTPPWLEIIGTEPIAIPDTGIETPHLLEPALLTVGNEWVFIMPKSKDGLLEEQDYDLINFRQFQMLEAMLREHTGDQAAVLFEGVVAELESLPTRSLPGFMRIRPGDKIKLGTQTSPGMLFDPQVRGEAVSISYYDHGLVICDRQDPYETDGPAIRLGEQDRRGLRFFEAP